MLKLESKTLNENITYIDGVLVLGGIILELHPLSISKCYSTTNYCYSVKTSGSQHRLEAHGYKISRTTGIDSMK